MVTSGLSVVGQESQQRQSHACSSKGNEINLCPGSSTTFTASLSPSSPTNTYCWTPTDPACPGCSTITAQPEFDDEYVVYASDGTCFVSNEYDPVKVKADNIISGIEPHDPYICTNGTADENPTLFPQLYPDVNPATINVICQWYDPSHSLIGSDGYLQLTSANVAGDYTVDITTENLLTGLICNHTYTVTVATGTCCTSTAGVNIYPATYKLSQVGAIPGNVTNGVLTINGNFHIDRDFTCDACDITMNENAKLIVDSAVLFKVITNSGTSELHGCGLWHGIVVSGSTSHLKLTGKTTAKVTVKDALMGVDATRDADITIRYCIFDKNETHVAMENYYTAADADNIYANTFQCSSGGYLPHHGTETCIRLKNCESVQVGTTATAAGLNNTFTQAIFGIYSINTAFDFRNNNFNNVFPIPSMTSLSRPGPIAVYAIQPDIYADRDIVSGAKNDANNSNTFDNNRWGVYVTGEYNTYLSENNFLSSGTFGANHRITDIYSALNTTKAITINQSQFDDINIGAQIYNSGRAADAPDVQILDNRLTGFYTISGSYYGTGILCTNPLALSSNLKIRRNNIINLRYGIVTGNVESAVIGHPDDIGASAQTINYNLTAAPTDHYSGIWVQYGDKTKIVNNVINNSTAFTGTGTFRGIDVENSAHCRINCNSITNLNYSMRFYANCDATLLRQNSMTGYDEAIHLDAAILPDQYQVNNTTGDYEPTDNIWNDIPNGSGTPTDRVTGTINGFNPINWYYRNTGGIYNPLDNGTTSQIILVQADAPGTVACDDYTNRHSRDDDYGRVVGDSLQFNEYADENAYQAKTNAFIAMKNDTSIMYEGNANDAAYQDFYSEMQQSNIGMFETVSDMAADSSRVSTAIEMNAEINDTNSFEYYKKTVNDIYLNTVAQGIELDATDSMVCDDISSLSYFTAGDAVYEAAAMINKEMQPVEVYTPMRKTHTVTKHEENSVALLYRIFPNPASAAFAIDGDISSLQEIKITGADGKLIKQFIQPQQKEYPVAEIPNGMYHVKLVENTGKTSYRKLTVLR